MTKLPQNLDWTLAQTRWASELNPVISCPIVNGILLPNIALTTGANSINHRLQRNLVGWLLVGNNAAVTLYDTQASNQTPQLTLNLVSDANASVTLWVF